MKKIIGLLLLATVLLSGCSDKKEVSPAQKIEDSYWYGRFVYTNQSLERICSVHLARGGKFTWRDLSGTYPGTWEVEDGVLTIIFDANGFTTTFSVSDKQLSDQKNVNHNTWQLAELSRIADYPKTLSGTEWQSRTYLIALTPARLIFYYSNLPNLIYGGGNYKLEGPVFTISDGQFQERQSAGIFAVFKNSTEFSANVLSGRSLSDPPTMLSSAEYFTLKKNP